MILLQLPVHVLLNIIVYQYGAMLSLNTCKVLSCPWVIAISEPLSN